MYPQHFIRTVLSPDCLGVCAHDDSRGVYWSQTIGTYEQGCVIKLSAIIDEYGMIVDARCSVFGTTACVGLAIIACEILRSSSVAYARSLSVDRLLAHISEQPPPEMRYYAHAIVDACHELPIGQHVSWESLSPHDKYLRVRDAVERYVHPHLARDGGGIRIHDVINDVVYVELQGACSSCEGCGSSLDYLQHVIRTISPSLLIQEMKQE